MVVVLAIGAHPDDIELGCWGTLTLLKLLQNQVHLLVLTKGEASGDPELKLRECRRSAKDLGVDGLYFGELKDTMITDGFETVQVIERIVNKIKPDIVFTHTYMDRHQDHRNTGYASLSACRQCKKILLYEGPATSLAFTPQLFINIEKTIEKKKRAITFFHSQSYKQYMASPVIEGLAKHRGYQCGVNYAESFEVEKFLLNIDELWTNTKI